MEQDRFAFNKILYIVGIVCLLLSITLFFFSMYILPFLIWDLHYDVPDFVSNIIAFFGDQYYYSSGVSKLFCWLIFFIPSLITGVISDYISNYIDNLILGVRSPEEIEEHKTESLEMRRGIRESVILSLKIFLLIGLIVFVVLLIQNFFQITR